MMVQLRVLRLWLKYVVSVPKLGFRRSEQSGRERAKSRKVAFHVDSTGSVTEEAVLRSHQEAARRSRRRVVHR
jgi:hypothetical protein